MKFVISAIILFSLLQISNQFAFRNDFEDDDIVEVYERHARDTDAIVPETIAATEQPKDIVEASGEEPLPKKSVVKRDKPETEQIEEASGQEEGEIVVNRPKRSTPEVEGSGQDDDIAGRQRRVAGEEIIEASGEEATTITA